MVNTADGSDAMTAPANKQGLRYSLPEPEVCQERARYVLSYIRSKAQSLPENQQLSFVLGELRRVNPFVLEDLYLHCCEDNGWPVIRPQYTEDGGIDGAFWMEESLFLVQSKRYKDFIQPEHIGAFDTVIQNHASAIGGLFIHTGRTGIEAHYYLEKSEGRVMLLSGQDLVDFVISGVTA
jgi:restriction system protein